MYSGGSVIKFDGFELDFISQRLVCIAYANSQNTHGTKCSEYA